MAPVATLTAAAERWATEPKAERRITPRDLREPRRESRTGNLLVLAVDASGSMGADRRMAAVKGALLGLLVDAYQRRDRVALVTFGGAGARVVLRPREASRSPAAGSRTCPPAARPRWPRGSPPRSTSPPGPQPDLRPILVVVTDGRATAGPEPFPAALAAAEAVARRRPPAVVVEVEPAGPAASAWPDGLPQPWMPATCRSRTCAPSDSKPPCEPSELTQTPRSVRCHAPPPPV